MASAEIGISSVTLPSGDEDSSISVLSSSSTNHQASSHKQTLLSHFLSAKQTRSSLSLPPKKRLQFHEDFNGNNYFSANDGSSVASATRSISSQGSYSFVSESTVAEKASHKNNTRTSQINAKKRRKISPTISNKVEDMGGFEIGMGYFSTEFAPAREATIETELAATLLILKDSTPSDALSLAGIASPLTASNPSSSESYYTSSSEISSEESMLMQCEKDKHTLFQGYIDALKQQYLQNN